MRIFNCTSWSPADAAASRSHRAVEEQDGQERTAFYVLQRGLRCVSHIHQSQCGGNEDQQFYR